MSEDQIKAAEFDVGRARSRLIATLKEISRQVEPHRLIEEAWDKAKDKGADIAENAVDAVSRRPLTTGAVVAGVVAFLARDSLISAAGKLFGGGKRKAPKRRKAGKAEPAPQKQTTEATE